ncbi:MAG TPA: PQQ-binding-like beta-propeller repeat protein [Anaerolineae bacterium]|nr:PQQ-binding-like beta-propeller repeat protein [Anaerolineae bacterium]
MFLNKRWSGKTIKLWFYLIPMLVSGLLVSSPAFAVDSWNVFQHDARHSGQSSYKAPKTPDILWIVPFGTTGKPTTPMAVAEDGRAFVGVDVTSAESTTTTTSEQAATGHSGIFAFSPKKKVLWVSKVTGKVSGPPAIGKDGTVYAAIGNNLVALNEKDGSTQWRIPLDGKSTGGVMVGKDGTVYTTTLEGKSLYAVSSDGKLKWKYTSDGKIGGSPAIGSDGTVYFTTQNLSLYAIGSNGSLKWRYGVTEKGTNSLTAPALATDDTIYFGAGRYEGTPGEEFLYAVSPDGKLKWRFKTEGKKVTMPAVAKGGTIIVGSTTLNYTEDRSLTVGDSYVQAIKPDGTSKWAAQTRDDEVIGAPIIDASGDIYVSSPDWYLTCLTKEGIMRWRAKIGGKVAIGPKGALYIAANSSVAAVGEKDVDKVAHQVQENLDNSEPGAGSTLSLLVYAIPVIVVLGMGYFFRSRTGSKDESAEE